MNVWVGGTFSPLHRGHVHLFRTASRLAWTPGTTEYGRVIVAVNTDEFVAKYKGQPPVQCLADRCTMIAEMRSVTEVQVNPGGDAQRELILAAFADIIAVGDDWAPPRDYLGQLGITQGWLDEHDIRVEFVPRVGELSSSALKHLIRAAPAYTL